MKEDILKKIISNYETPTYVFDIKNLKERINYLKNNLPKKVNLCYAIKANTFIVKDIESNIERFEVCSPGEYQICKENNIDKSKILISGVYKTPNVIKQMIQDDITYFTIESMEQFELIKNSSSKNKLEIMIRLTSGNQFGINESEVEEIIKNRNHYENMEIVGIQYFSGTQKTSLKRLQKEIEYIDEFVENIQNKYDIDIQELEFGAGLPVYYFQNTEFDENEFLKEFSNIINNMKYSGKLIFELGRSIAASCGTYITKVVDKKTNKNENYAIVDGGMNHIVYYGQSMAMKVPKCYTYPQRDGQEENWNLCGALCTINDILVKQFPIKDLQIGDYIVFENTGAYCMTEGISLFLSRNLPQVLKIKENNEIELVRENLPTYKFNM